MVFKLLYNPNPSVILKNVKGREEGADETPCNHSLTRNKARPVSVTPITPKAYGAQQQHWI